MMTYNEVVKTSSAKRCILDNILRSLLDPVVVPKRGKSTIINFVGSC